MDWCRLALRGLEFWDPAPFEFAELCRGLLFDQRGIAPSAAEVQWFDIVLLAGSGIQWVLLGVVGVSLGNASVKLSLRDEDPIIERGWKNSLDPSNRPCHQSAISRSGLPRFAC